MSVFRKVNKLAAADDPVALITVVAKEGSAPREIGAKMLVTETDEYATIGGGSVEAIAVEDARAVLRGEAEIGRKTYELRRGGNTGMVCGGSMDVFIDLPYGC